MGTGKPVRIGCYSAFWGDSVAAAEQLVQLEKDNLDYLVADYLAEVTMGILARRRKSSNKLGGAGAGGYVAEFITFVLARLLPDLVKYNIKIITNAGGLDPIACKKAIEEYIASSGVDASKCKVAAVSGDDLIPQYEELRKQQKFRGFSNIKHGGVDENDSTSDKFPSESNPPVSLNAYFGAIPIAQALNEGANIIVTGRVVDSAVVVGPLIHEFGWDPSKDFDQLAAGSLAGHIIECGCQTTGGNFTDWALAAFSENGGYANMGYPIVECFPGGEFVVTKPKKTGGLVTTATVGEQMLYEILDPGAYLLPDVVLDLRQVRLEQIGKDRVRVSGAKGRKPTAMVKCSGVYVDGYKLSGEMAKAVAQAIVTRTRGMLKRFGMPDFRDVNIEILGTEHTYGPQARHKDTREVVMRLCATHDDPKALTFLAMEVAPSGTCMAPGITGAGAGRPRAAPNLTHFSSLLPKSLVRAKLTVGSTPTRAIDWPTPGDNASFEPPSIPGTGEEVVTETVKTEKVKLIELAYGRSGDKGDACNVGIMARDPRCWVWIKSGVTEDKVKACMGHLVKGDIKRYELPGSLSLNFVLTKALGGGGLSSLNIDRQGKTYAQMVLTSLEIDAPVGLAAELGVNKAVAERARAKL